MDYAKEVSATSQTTPVPGKNQVKNNAGGFVFSLDMWGYLRRFLILGSESNTYYQKVNELTVKNAANLLACIKEDPRRTYALVMSLRESNACPKPDTLVFALACLLKYAKDPEVVNACINAVPVICYSGTQILQLASFIKTFGGWSAVTRRAVNNWYKTNHLKDNLGLQLIKYQSRNGWSHRDVLRLSHPKAIVLPDGASSENMLYKFAVGKMTAEEVANSPLAGQRQFMPIVGYHKAKIATIDSEVAQAIKEYNIPRECVPTEHLNNALVWDALLEKMPTVAMLRNLGKMGAVSLLVEKSQAVKTVINHINNISSGKEGSRNMIHPIQILQALYVYKMGRGIKGDNVWKPVAAVIDALDTAFYRTFKTVVPTGKRINIALDVSGSMGGGEIAGLTGMNPREASAAMALVTYKTEENCHVNAFSPKDVLTRRMSNSAIDMIDIPVPSGVTLPGFIKQISGLPFTTTDCSAPILKAMEENKLYDAFIIYTDNETYAGSIHPFQALKQYHQKTGIAAKLIVVGMTATQFTIADPSSPHMFDVVGFDSTAPSLIADFIRE